MSGYNRKGFVDGVSILKEDYVEEKKNFLIIYVHIHGTLFTFVCIRILKRDARLIGEILLGRESKEGKTLEDGK